MKGKLFLAAMAVGFLTASGFAARYEQLNVNELTVTTIINGSTEISATGAELNRAADLSAGQRAVSVTNGQAVAITSADAVIALTGIGSASGNTNTITISQPYPAGNRVLFYVDSDSTNLVGLADSTTVLSLGSDVALSATDCLDLYFVATNKAIKVSTSDN